MDVKVSVTQITHGLEYEGTIEGLDGSIHYHLSFGVPIDKLDSQKMPEDQAGMRARAMELFNFTVTKDDLLLEITDELFGFMVSTAGQVSLSLYNNPQTQDYATSDGLLAGAIKNKQNSLLGSFGMSASIGMSTLFDVSNNSIPRILQ